MTLEELIQADRDAEAMYREAVRRADRGVGTAAQAGDAGRKWADVRCDLRDAQLVARYRTHEGTVRTLTPSGVERMAMLNTELTVQ